MDEFIPSIKVIFCLTGDEFDLDEVTHKMEMTPTGARTKAEFPPTGLAHTEWYIEELVENAIAVTHVFKKLLQVLTPKEKNIQEICSDLDVQASFVVIIHMQDGDSPEVVLTREIIAFTAAIHADVVFGLYCYENE